MVKLRSVHSIHSYWKSKQMLTTYMGRMSNNNLENRIAGSSCRPQLNILKEANSDSGNYKRMGTSFRFNDYWDSLSGQALLIIG